MEISLITLVLPHFGHLCFCLLRSSYSDSDQISSNALLHFSQRNSYLGIGLFSVIEHALNYRSKKLSLAVMTLAMLAQNLHTVLGAALFLGHRLHHLTRSHCFPSAERSMASFAFSSISVI
jgi:hypothetical protein